MAVILARVLGWAVDIQIPMEEEVKPKSSTWPQEDIEKLTELWSHSGLSGTQISVEFGGKYSKMAVIGKARRLKLPARIPGTPSSVVREMKRARSATAPEKGALRFVFGPHRVPVPKDPRPVRKQAWEPIPGIEPVSLMDRTGCCWIVTQDSPFLYCNHPVDEGSKLSYCSHHLDMYVSKERPARIRVKGLA